MAHNLDKGNDELRSLKLGGTYVACSGRMGLQMATQSVQRRRQIPSMLRASKFRSNATSPTAESGRPK